MKKFISILLMILLPCTMLAGCVRQYDAAVMGVSLQADKEDLTTAASSLLEDYRNADSTACDTVYGKVAESLKNNIDLLTISQYLDMMINELNKGASSPMNKELFSKLSYEITDLSIDGETGTVSLSMTNLDIGSILDDVSQRAANGENIFDEDYLNNFLNSDNLPTFTNTCEMVFTCENDSWELFSVDNDFSNLILYNSVNWLENFTGSVFGEEL